MGLSRPLLRRCAGLGWDLTEFTYSSCCNDAGFRRQRLLVVQQTDDGPPVACERHCGGNAPCTHAVRGDAACMAPSRASAHRRLCGEKQHALRVCASAVCSTFAVSKGRVVASAMVAAKAPEAKSSRKLFCCASPWNSVMPCTAAAVHTGSCRAGAAPAALPGARAPRVLLQGRCRNPCCGSQERPFPLLVLC